MSRTGALERLTAHPTTFAMLPLLHAVWSDGSLDDDEIETLCTSLRLLVGEGADCHEELGTWLDPTDPPSADEIARLGAVLRIRVNDKIRTLTPVDVGLHLMADQTDSSFRKGLHAADRTLGPFSTAATAVWDRTEERSTLAPLPEPGEAGFDAIGIRRLVAGPYTDIKERVYEILCRPDFRPVPIDDVRLARARVTEWTAVLADEGIGGLGLPVEYGGSGDPAGFIAAFQAIGHHDPSLLTKFGVQFGLYAGAILRLGEVSHHRAWLPSAIAFQIPGCFALSETGHGSNVMDLGTIARYLPESEEFELVTPTRLDRKDYIGNAAVDGRMAVVFAQLRVGDLDHGVHAFVVPIRTADGESSDGVDIEDDGLKAGLNGVDNGRIGFDRVRVPRDALLSRFASVDPDGVYRSSISSPARRFFTTLGTLVGGRVSVATAATSVAETCLAIAVRYAVRRRQFGIDASDEIKLIDYRSHQRRLLPRVAATYAYHFASAELAAEYVEIETRPGDDGRDRREFEGRAAGLKAFASWHALETAQECREACGGQGYLAINRIGVLRADVDVFTTYEGDNTVLAQLLAKALLTEYRSSFDDLTPLRMVRYLGRRVSTYLTDTVPLLGAVSDGVDQLPTLTGLLDRRSDHVLETLANRVNHRIGRGVGASEAFLDVQPHAIAAARAHVERLVFAGIVRHAEPIDDPAFTSIAALAGLWWVERDLGWFLEHGHLTPSGAAAVRAGITRLCSELAPDARHLVDAFGIPDEVLAAPIAL